MNLLVHRQQERLICFDCNVSNDIAAIDKFMGATGGKGRKSVRQDFPCQQVTCCEKLIKKPNQVIPWCNSVKLGSRCCSFVCLVTGRCQAKLELCYNL